MSLIQSYLKILDAHHGKLATEYMQYIPLKKSLNEHADHLCRAVPFLARGDGGYSGRMMAIRPLNFLSLHFKEQKDWAKLAWCTHCAVELGSIGSQKQQDVDVVAGMEKRCAR